jgi:crotonobetainyl-CoA:carnitine CoA-transferase CaiB-like acyl-CoA transferase
VRLGDVVNAGSAANGKPLDGVRVLALEQMQALPYATQLLTRLGAEVVKVEPPGGDQGRDALPAIEDPEGRRVGATFLRNNLNKRSVCIDLKSPAGREIVLRLAPRFDVVAENSRAGVMARLGLGYHDVAEVHPGVVYLSLSGFGSSGDSPYATWPAFAPIAEAMSGIYEFKRAGDDPPVVAPVGALGDIGTALFGVIGVLAGLRHRDLTGRGQHVDVAMLDSMVAMTDLVANFWSLGLRGGDLGPLIMHGFRASDGWFVVQVGREHQFARLVATIGHPEWADDARFASRQGWIDHLESDLRPAIESWASTRTKTEAAAALGGAGIAAGPCLTDDEVVHDPHLAARAMLVECPRPDGGPPVLVPGNPVKMSAVAEGPESRVPWLGEHTDEVLRDELGCTDEELTTLRADGTIT